MPSRTRHENNLERFYDSSTQETLFVAAPVWFVEDFLGKAFDTTNIWTARDTNGADETVSADAGNGILSLALTNANEAQLAGYDWGDNRTLVLNQGLNIEFRFKLSVIPTGAVVMCLGLCGDHNAAVNTVAESIWFRADGSGAITVETDDTSNETSAVATGTTLINTDWCIARIDCTTITDVRFYINGTRVASGTTFNMSTVAGLALQPVMRIGKEAAATTVGTLLVDYCKVWMKRAA